MKSKENFLLLAMLVIFVLASGCDEKPTETVIPPEIEDIVPQINIPWPSLADTPWPMYHHDPQSTGRSEYVGPQLGIINSVQLDDFSTMSGISIGYDKIAFIPASDNPNSLLYSFDYEGNPIWSQSILGSYSTPLISNDSSVYVASQDNIFLALKHNGDTLWTTPIDDMYNKGMNIDKEGNIYFIDIKGSYPNYIPELNVLDKNGKILWTLQDDRILGTPFSMPAFSPDGNTLYVQGKEVSVLAIDINSQSVKWVFGNQILYSSPVIDNAGNLYVVKDKDFDNNKILYSIAPDGNTNWEFKFTSSKRASSAELSIDYNGNIYFAIDTLYSVSNSGKFRWKNYLDGGLIVSAIVCDKENTIYFGTELVEKVFAFADDGELKWKTDELEFRTLGACPAITDEGSLLFPSWRNYHISLSKIK